jgi:excisionase family DNA binding protein
MLSLAKLATESIFHDYADVVTVPEMAKMLRIGRNTAYGLVNSGQIPFVRVGNQIRIPKSSVIDFVEQK